jgi:ATP diphosphatase
MQPSRDIARLIEIMAALRAPETGCAWDLKQNFASIAPYTIEEAYEVADAIERGDLIDLRDELGDLLLQVVFHARMAQEQGAFDFGGVVEAITSKMIRRHPHVFGDAGDLTPEQVSALWSEIKAREKAGRAAAHAATGAPAQPASLLADVPTALPALTRAVKLQDKAAKVGFDWSHVRHVVDKLREETDEVEAAFAAGDADHIAEEIGDILFVVANLARHAKADPERVLRAANAKFERRFGYIEQKMVETGRDIAAASLEDMDFYWNEAKSKGL